MCRMETRRQSNGVATATTQPMSAHAMLCGTAGKRLATAARYARVVGMKTRPNTGGAAAGTAQTSSSGFPSHGVTSIRPLEQRHKLGIATLDSMATTQEQTAATRSRTAAIRSSRSHEVRAAPHQFLSLSLDSRTRR